MSRYVMTDADRWTIVNAPNDESTAALARRIGAPYQATYAFRAKVRRAGGWSYAVSWETCEICGEALMIPPRQHITKRHAWCRTEASRRTHMIRRQTNANARDAIYQRARARQDALQEATYGMDTNSRQPWSEEDNQYLLDHRADLYTLDGVVRLARVLGRSFSACESQLQRLDQKRTP